MFYFRKLNSFSIGNEGGCEVGGWGRLAMASEMASDPMVGGTAPDGWLAAPDGWLAASNGGLAAPDGGLAAPDGWLAAPDGWLAAPDAPLPVLTRL
jgi:hypothetical protein